MRRTLRTLVVAFILTGAAVALPATQADGATPAKRHTQICVTAKCLMVTTAAHHGWGAAEVADEWLVLWRESRSTPTNFNLTATNGTCYGSGQLQGTWTDLGAKYYAYGGNPNTVAGQITGDLNYVAAVYKDPVHAWWHEEADDWY